MATIGGKLLLSATLQEPLSGFWVADIEADSEEDLTGAVTLDLDGVTFAGTVHRGDLFRGRWHGRIVAGGYGAGRGPRARVAAKFYAEGIALRLVLSDIAAAMGLTVDTATSDAAVLDRVLGQWQRAEGPAAHALAALVHEADVRFHVTRAGLLRVAAPTYAELTPAPTTELLTEDPQVRTATYAPLTPELLPDRAIGGRRCSYVLTVYGPGGLRQVVWFED